MAAQLRPKNLIPLAHVEHGWVFGNSISVFGPDVNKAVGNDVGEVVQIPLDELDRYFTPPFALAIAADKSVAYISTTGSDSVTVIDIAKMLEFIDRKSTRLNSSHLVISYAVFCLKKKKTNKARGGGPGQRRGGGGVVDTRVAAVLPAHLQVLYSRRVRRPSPSLCFFFFF